MMQRTTKFGFGRDHEVHSRLDADGPMAGEAALPLVIGVSTRVLFDLEEEHCVFVESGAEAYDALQRKREDAIPAPGPGFDVIRRFTALNRGTGIERVRVVLLSKNPPDHAVRLYAACERHCLPIVGGSFTCGRSVAPAAAAWGVDLFLSSDEPDVRAALSIGIAAARMSLTKPEPHDAPTDGLHVALDGDSVIFGSEPDRIFDSEGLAVFERHERDHARIPIEPGPFGKTFLRKLARIRELGRDENSASPVRISLITARNAPAHERAIRTLRAWGVTLDEAHFVGSRIKAPFLCAAGAHIFFDDRDTQVVSAGRFVSAGWAPRSV